MGGGEEAEAEGAEQATFAFFAPNPNPNQCTNAPNVPMHQCAYTKCPKCPDAPMPQCPNAPNA